MYQTVHSKAFPTSFSSPTAVPSSRSPSYLRMRMNARAFYLQNRPWVASLLLLSLGFLGSQLQAQIRTPEQTLALMEKCRQQVVSELSFADKLKMKAAMNAIQNDPRFITANNAVKNASTPEAQIQARKVLGRMKLDLVAHQDPSLRPVVEKIRSAQASLLK